MQAPNLWTPLLGSTQTQDAFFVTLRSHSRFQITISNDLDVATMFYQRLIVVLALVDFCVVRRYKTSQISQRVTHESFQQFQNMARVFLLYVKKFR